MAVSTTGAMYKALTFDGESSRNYGVYISGEAVFNAPERDVEMVSIPGRNGSFALDNGRYQNIEVTYPAGIYADNASDFASAISDFRNMLCSRTGYCRLTDEYHPNEYRMAIYKSGLEVSPVQLLSGEFSITFECKPQRWLTSGESAVTVADGGTITNPTLYDASPLLEVEGYGNIDVNGYDIEIENETLGYTVLLNSGSVSSSTWSTVLSSNYFNNNDTITIGASTPILSITLISSINGRSDATVTNGTLTWTGAYTGECAVSLPAITITAGTDSTDTVQYVATYQVRITGGVIVPETITIDIDRTYTSSTNTVQYTGTVTVANGTVASSSWTLKYGMIAVDDSSVSILGNPTYIDCDLGEAYKIESDTLVDLNSNIDLGSNLPVLSPGSNTVTYDNTVTDFKIVPNWWQL